jgi:hypothetical protein
MAAAMANRIDDLPEIDDLADFLALLGKILPREVSAEVGIKDSFAALVIKAWNDYQ